MKKFIAFYVVAVVLVGVAVGFADLVAPRGAPAIEYQLAIIFGLPVVGFGFIKFLDFMFDWSHS